MVNGHTRRFLWEGTITQAVLLGVARWATLSWWGVLRLYTASLRIYCKVFTTDKWVIAVTSSVLCS